MNAPPGQVVALLMVGVAVLFAFLPAIWAHAQTGTWYMNAWLQDSFSPEQAYITAHAVTGMALLGLLFAQVATGMSSERFQLSRRYHRAAGLWVVLPLVVVSLTLAVNAQAIEYIHSGSPHIFFNLAITVIIIAEIVAGVYHAKRRCIAKHKDWMLWALIDIASAGGLSRAGMYLMQPAFTCDPFLSDWPLFFATAAGTLVAAYCFHASGRLGRQYKANLAMLTVHVLVACYSLAASIPFDHGRDMNRGMER